jgi:hypothetical protein
MPAFTVELPDGKRMDVEAADEASALAGAQDWYSKNAKTDTSYAGAVTQGVSDVASGVGKTIKNYFSPETGAAIEQKGQKLAPANYNSATEDFMNRGGAWYDKNWSSAPRALAENAPALATDVLAGLAGEEALLAATLLLQSAPASRIFSARAAKLLRVALPSALVTPTLSPTRKTRLSQRRRVSRSCSCGRGRGTIC